MWLAFLAPRDEETSLSSFPLIDEVVQYLEDEKRHCLRVKMGHASGITSRTSLLRHKTRSAGGGLGGEVLWLVVRER